MPETPKEDPRSPNVDDLESDYANNVAYEQTVWDLKLIFGEYSDRLKTTEWHTSITIPWAQAKLMLYYLKLNLEAYESEHGKIYVPPGVLPPGPETIPIDPNNPEGTKNIKALVERLRNELLESLK